MRLMNCIIRADFGFANAHAVHLRFRIHPSHSLTHRQFMRTLTRPILMQSLKLAGWLRIICARFAVFYPTNALFWRLAVPTDGFRKLFRALPKQMSPWLSRAALRWKRQNGVA